MLGKIFGFRNCKRHFHQACPGTHPLLVTYGVPKFLCYVLSLQFRIKQVTRANIEYADEQTEAARLARQREGGEEKFVGKRGAPCS